LVIPDPVQFWLRPTGSVVVIQTGLIPDEVVAELREPLSDETLRPWWGTARLQYQTTAADNPGEAPDAFPRGRGLQRVPAGMVWLA
jgi:hypothetical protein